MEISDSQIDETGLDTRTSPSSKEANSQKYFNCQYFLFTASRGSVFSRFLTQLYALLDGKIDSTRLVVRTSSS